jgi:predicted alpha/beta superfamily hydrolase
MSITSYGQEITEIDINSTHLNEIKVLRVFIPEDYVISKKKYPLTIILDSEMLFESYVASAKLFSNSKINPQQIIVGIKQFEGIDKNKDYGYNSLNSYPSSNSINTLEFIKQELIPTIKKRYRIASFKTIVGTEVTANFLNYFLFEKNPIFDAYISINPELAPDMPTHLKGYAPQLTGNDTYYYMSHGNNTIQKDKKLIDATDVGLIGVSNLYFNYKYENFKNAATIISIPQSLASAQEFIFSMYSPISDHEYETSISFLSPPAAIQYLLYKYENIEYVYGEKLSIRQEDFIKTEPILLDKEKGGSLEEYGELALRIHPTSPIGNYYMGQYFEKKEEYAEALLAYKKGYAKIPQTSPKSYGYYMNIKRIISLQKLEEEEQREREEREAKEESLADVQL